MNRLRVCLLAGLAVVAFGAGVAWPGSALAAPLAPADVPATKVVDALGMNEVVELTERMAPHLYMGDDGLVRLADVSARGLGVTERFLADYRAALEYSNALIESGEIVVGPDLRVTMNDVPRIPGEMPLPAPGDTTYGAPSDTPAIGITEPLSDVPQWGAWNYGQGAMFYNSYEDWTYFRYGYFGLCNSMAAYIRLPWMSRSLIYFYGYNQHYLGQYCYPYYGTYFYIPFAYCGQQLGYKPAYFWGQQYGYSSSCRCYCHQWLWLGFWCRY